MGMADRIHLYRSLAKEGLLWIVHPSQSFASISCWGPKQIWKSAHLAKALQIGIFHCLASCGETGLHTLLWTNYAAA